MRLQRISTKISGGIMTVITRRLAVLALISLDVCTSTSWAATSPVGATLGSFVVSPSGSATYTIPITVPPGVSGMQPNISLSYDSQSGNGLLGVGWNFAGLSVIHRCGATIDRDGFKGGVNLDGNDKFCLNGQRLIAQATTTVACSNCTEYRTDRETFVRVVSYGTQGGGPQGWRVWTKPGQILEYGKLTDEPIAAPESRIAVSPTSSTVIAWPINLIKDTVGNYLTVTYTINSIASPASDEYYPSRIDYTGNAAAGLAASRSIQFQYETRPDVTTAYVGGVAVNTTQRLTHVYTYSGATPVRDYRVTYEALPSTTTASSRVSNLTECIFEGNVSVCLPSINTGWQDGAVTFAYAGNLHTTPADATKVQSYFMDENGEGKADLVAWDGYGNYASYLSNGVTFTYAGNLHTTPADASKVQSYVMDEKGEGKDDLVAWDGYGNYASYLVGGIFPDLLTSITTSLGAATTLTYKPLTDNSVYTQENSAVYPVRDVQGSTYVVASYQASNGVGGLNTTSYSYSGAKVHQTGRGFLNFHTITQTAPSGIKTTTTYGQTSCTPTSTTTSDMRCIGLPLQVDTFSGSTKLSTTTTAWDTIGNYPYATKISQSAWDTDTAHTAFPTFTTTNQPPDAYGNILQTNVSTSDGYTTQTANTYLGADTANWFIGRLSSSTVTKSVPDSTVSPVTLKSAFQYNGNGLLVKEVVEPNTMDALGNYTVGVNTLVTDYTYDSYGHRNSTTVSGPDITTRTSRSDYVTSPGAASVQITNTNAKGHTETQTIDARFGVVSSLTGPNGLITSWGYDGFGRQISESRADGTSTTIAFYVCPGATCPSGAPSNAKYAVTTTPNGATPITVFYDMLARAVRRSKLGFNSATIYQDTTYDNLGYVRTASRPYYSGGAVYNDTTYFDELGSPRSALPANGLSTTYGYAGLTSTVTLSHSTLPSVETTTQVKNGVGGLISVTDAQGKVTSYKYDPFGNLLKTIDPNGNAVTMTYDVRGRKRTMVDPDMGNWTYGYNVAGEITSQVNAKGQSSSMHYDVLGRMDSRTENEGTSTWIYDNATGKGIGKLASVSGPGGYARTYVYDTLSRPVRVSTTIAGTTYVVDTGYDGYSRVSSVQYPNTGSSRYTVYSCYDSNGYLNVVTTASSCVSPATWYWKATVMDSLGNVTTESLGNGLTTARSYGPTNGLVSNINTNNGIQNINYNFDALGSLTGRNDTVNSVNETFQYDTLNRLTAVTGPANKSYAYDALGNITNKSDFGDTYIYGETSAQPAGPHAGTTVKKAGVIVASYRYDANGNMTSGPGRTVTYTSFNLPSQVTQGSVINTFTYSAEHERTVETSSNGDITVQLSPRWDNGVHFEKVTHTSAPTEYLHYIYAGSTPVAIYTVKSDGTNNTKYLHKDHLGSVVATTNASGVLIERMSYDAFGKRRLANGLEGSVTISSTHHGFTGHEMMDEVGLINMNGRQYDPTLGRFIESDPSIQGAVNLQSFNRYSYVLENPLSLVEPSGYNWASKMWHKHVNKLVFGIVPNTPFVKEEFRRSYILRTIGSITAATYGPWGTAVYSAYLSRVVYGTSRTDAASSAAITGGTSYLNM